MKVHIYELIYIRFYVWLIYNFTKMLGSKTMFLTNQDIPMIYQCPRKKQIFLKKTRSQS